MDTAIRCCGFAASAFVAWGLFVFITVLSFAIQTSGASCRADLTDKVTKFLTTNLICEAYNFPANSNGYVVWALRDNTTQATSMVVAAPLNSGRWAGIGFSADGQMPGATALVATLSSTGITIVKEYSLKARDAAGVVEGNALSFVGGSPDAIFDQPSNTVYMSFQVDFTKSTAKADYLLMAYGSSSADGLSINYHDDRTIQTAQFVSGVVTGQSAADKLHHKAKTHGALQILGLGILLPVGTLIARYARGFDPAWFYLHATFQILGFAIIIAGVAAGIDLAKSLQPDNLAAHRGLGLFIFALVFLQILAIVLRPKKEAKVRRYWNWYHGWVGRLALFLSAVNIFLGIHIANEEHRVRVAYAVILTLELLAFVILEILLWVRWKRQPHQQSTTPDAFQFGGSV